MENQTVRNTVQFPEELEDQSQSLKRKRLRLNLSSYTRLQLCRVVEQRET